MLGIMGTVQLKAVRCFVCKRNNLPDVTHVSRGVHQEIGGGTDPNVFLAAANKVVKNNTGNLTALADPSRVAKKKPRAASIWQPALVSRTCGYDLKSQRESKGSRGELGLFKQKRTASNWTWERAAESIWRANESWMG